MDVSGLEFVDFELDWIKSSFGDLDWYRRRRCIDVDVTMAQKQNTVCKCMDPIKERKLNKEEEEEKQDCSICLLAIEGSISELECGHGFHSICIKEWLSLKITCPICRQKTCSKKDVDVEADVDVDVEVEVNTNYPVTNHCVCIVPLAEWPPQALALFGLENR